MFYHTFSVTNQQNSMGFIAFTHGQSEVGSGRNSNSFEIFSLSLLPAKMKKIH